MKPWMWVLVILAAMVLVPFAFGLVLGTVFWLLRLAITVAVIVFVAGLVLRLMGVRSG